MKKYILLLLLASVSLGAYAQNNSLKLALLKYRGGGDWYADPTALPNLTKYCNQHLFANMQSNYATVEAGSAKLFNYPFVHMTGHGNVLFSEQEAENIRLYLQAGGFLHIDDNYGMDPYVRRELKKLFPEKNLVQLGKTHPIFQEPYSFPEGLPKIHEHDKKPPQAFAVFIDERIAILYTYESDISDGWEDPSVHNDPPELREKALKMGANIIYYCFTQ